MSCWTYIDGTITVEPMGRTQEEKEYILKTVINHLPKVTGSENDMYIKIMEKESGCRTSSTHNEFDEYIPDGWSRSNDEYIIIVYGSFRDRMFEETYREFIKWITRLAKRVVVKHTLVEISGHRNSDYVYHSEIITNNLLSDGWNTRFGQMFEEPSWYTEKSNGEPTWCEYLMWKRDKKSGMPRVLKYKYYADKDNDRKVEDWID